MIRTGVHLCQLQKRYQIPPLFALPIMQKTIITIQQGPGSDQTEICINRSIEVLDGTFWTIEGFMSIID